MTSPNELTNTMELPERYAIPAGFEIGQDQLSGYGEAFSPFLDASSKVSSDLDVMRNQNGLDEYGIADVPNTIFNMDDRSPDVYLKEVPGFLGAGDDKEVFEGPTVNGVQTVLKRMRLNVTDERTIVDQYGSLSSPDAVQAANELLRAKLLSSAAPLVAGQGHEHLEQLIGLDLDSGFMVTQRAKDERVYDMSGMDMLSKMRKRHVDEVSRTLDDMRKLGLHPHNLGGIFFDSNYGFNFVDYVIEDQSDHNNPVPIGSTEEFIGFVLSDHKRLQNYASQRAMGVPRSSLSKPREATGVRGLHRASMLKRAREIDGEQK
jgi:hypothetical protein